MSGAWVVAAGVGGFILGAFGVAWVTGRHLEKLYGKTFGFDRKAPR